MRSQVRTDVLAALPDEFTEGRKIWNKVGKWSPYSIQVTLKDLCVEKLAERISRPRPGGTIVYLYRKAKSP